MRKKLFMILAVLLCAAALIVGLVSCDKDNEEGCEHKFEDGECKYCGQDDPEGRGPKKEGAFTYRVEGNGCIIIAFDPSAYDGVEVEIPSSINGKPVVGVYADTGKGVFEGCDTIEKIVIPDSVTSVGSNTFKDCTSLQSLTSCQFDGFRGWFDYDLPQSLKEIIITEGREYISSEEFKNCPYIESITIPASVKEIGWEAFNGCSALQNIYYTGTIADWCHITFDQFTCNHPMYYAENFYLWENGAFELVETLVIPEGITTIKALPFSYFKVETIVIPDSVESIEDCAFYECTSLKTIVLGSGVRAIGNAFAYCEAVSEIWYKGSADDYRQISINGDTNQQIFAEATKYYYAEEFSVFDYADGDVAWHYNRDNEPELWSFDITDTVAGTRYRYESTELTISEEYWQMLQQSEAQGMLEYVLDADALAVYNDSETPEEFRAGMLALTQSMHAGIEVVFNDGMITVYQNGEQATYPLSYVVVDGSDIYYRNNETLAYVIRDGKIIEDLSDEYGTVLHTYVPVSE